jgi:hypothetical protein
MPTSYTNPYGSTTFPIGSGSPVPNSYGSTTFPIGPGSPVPNSYGQTNFSLIDDIFGDNESLTKNQTIEIKLDANGNLQSKPKPISNTPTIVLGKDQETEINPTGYTYSSRVNVVSQIGNVQPGSIFKNALRNAAVGVASGLGNPMTHQFSSVAINSIPIGNIKDTDGIDTRPINLGVPFSSMPFTRKAEIENWAFGKYKDFRAFKGYIFSVNDTRLDGASAATRGIRNKDVNGSVFGAAYAAASATPGGVYKLINLESVYGWGNHGDINALRRDFTSRSHVATRWKLGQGNSRGSWVPTVNPVEVVTEFRGDKINVIDFGERKLSQVYRWKPETTTRAERWNNFVSATDLTKDFIKFYFTGPKLQNGIDETDDIIVFRASITEFSDTHSPSWQSVQMIGRADPNYIYTGYNREVSLSFTVYATSRDEMKPIYRKLNALAGYTVPDYANNNTIAMKSPWMRMTIGDLLVQQAVLINSLTYTFVDTDTTWEINIEDDPTMMQVPHKISVSMGLNVITDSLPQKHGRMYTLAKQFAESSVALEGGDNWLSDINETAANIELQRRLAKSQQPDTNFGTDNSKPPATVQPRPLTEAQQLEQNKLFTPPFI